MFFIFDLPFFMPIAFVEPSRAPQTKRKQLSSVRRRKLVRVVNLNGPAKYF